MDGRRFLQQTLQRQRRREEEEESQRAYRQQRQREAVCGLRESIAASRGSLQANLLLRTEREGRGRKEEEKEKERIIRAGGNPHEEFLKQRRVAEYEAKLAEFAQKQRETEVEMVVRLLAEERQQRRTQRLGARPHWQGRSQVGSVAPSASTPQCPCHAHTQVPRLPKKGQKKRMKLNPSTGHRSSDVQESRTAADTESSEHAPPPEVHREEGEEEGEEVEEEGEEVERESLAEPEIRGLWDRKGGSSRPRPIAGAVLAGEGEEEVAGRKPLSKLEREMRKAAMESLRKSVVVRQVAAGREFKVCIGGIYCIAGNFRGTQFLREPRNVVFVVFIL